MKTKIYSVTSILLAFVFFGTSCKKDKTDGPVSKSNIVIIDHDITQVTTWSSDSIYVIEAWDFYVDNLLSIEAGTIIKFHSGPDLTLSGDGTIIANGTASKPIIFTSYKDDDHGGDTNGDGSNTSPARKDWNMISTNGNNGSSFTYCNFYYGGGGSYSQTLAVESGSTGTVKYCTFAHNDGGDATGWYGALDVSDASMGTTIDHNIFFDNIRPLSVNVHMNIDDSNIFHNPDNIAETNQYNGIFVETIDEIYSAVTWSATEVPYVIDDNDWYIYGTGSLTLADKVVLKFRPGSELVLDIGVNAISNYNGKGVYFTSYKDDSRKGDTNGDGTLSTPSNGDWIGIYDNNSSQYMNWTNVFYDNH